MNTLSSKSMQTEFSCFEGMRGDRIQIFCTFVVTIELVNICLDEYLLSVSLKITFLLEIMIVKEKLREFCQNTTVHGLGFIVDTKSTLFKRLAWLVIFLLSVSYAGIQLKESIDGK